MNGNADQTRRRASVVAGAAEQASTGLQTVAAASEEPLSSIAEISRQVAQSTKLTSQAVADAQRTDTIVRAVAEAAIELAR